MVRSVRDDSRGIVDPARLLANVAFDRHPPIDALTPFVDAIWVITWDLGDRRHTQHLLTHPVVNLSTIGPAHGGDRPVETAVTGVVRRRDTRVLERSGRVIGVKFRPAGFRPFVDRPLSALTDRVVAVADVLGPDVAREVTAVAHEPDDGRAVARLQAAVASVAPTGPHPSDEIRDIVEDIAGDRSIRRVGQLAAELHMSIRQLQRRFVDDVGVSPTWIIRRYRLHDAAEAAAKGIDISWSQLAAELGYSDQAHLVRAFTTAIGTPPERYAQQCREGAVAVVGPPP